MTDTSMVIESPKAKVRAYSEYMNFNNMNLSSFPPSCLTPLLFLL